MGFEDFGGEFFGEEAEEGKDDGAGGDGGEGSDETFGV